MITNPSAHDRAFTTTATVMGASCAAIGLAHTVFGARSVIGVGPGANVNEDSQERFYGGVFVGYGAAWLWAAHRHPRSIPVTRFLAATMSLGGIGRLISIRERGLPHSFWLSQLAIEFAVPGVLVWLAGRPRSAGNRS